MLPSPKGSEGDHAPDILRSITVVRILAAIDEEIARLNKVRALLSTSASAKAGAAAARLANPASSVSLPGRGLPRHSGNDGPNRREGLPGSKAGLCSAEPSTGKRLHQRIIPSAKENHLARAGEETKRSHS